MMLGLHGPSFVSELTLVQSHLQRIQYYLEANANTNTAVNVAFFPKKVALMAGLTKAALNERLPASEMKP